jgi:hypothetical protein
MATLSAGLADSGLSVAADVVLTPPRGATRPMRTLEDTTPSVVVDVGPGEGAVVLVQANGIYTWVQADEVPPAQRRRARRQVRFAIAALPTGVRRRGILTEWLTDLVVDQIRVTIFKFVGRWTASTLAMRLEASIVPTLLIMRGVDPAGWRAAALPAPASGKLKVLLFVHGTFSSTRGSFAHLLTHEAGRSFFAAAAAIYDVVLGFDHRTLTEDAMTNAKQLLAALQDFGIPPNTSIDCVAFSRGGLVIRSLIENLLVDIELLPDVKVGRVIFVGCTNGGTHLADAENVTDLIDVYTNLFVRAASMIGPFGGPGGIAISKALSSSFTLIGRFVQAVGDAAINDEAVPGLAAMRPDGDAVKALNNAAAPGSPDATYFAVSADFEPRFDLSGNLAKEGVEIILDRIADRLFKNAANDLVVDTVEMTNFGTLAARLADRVFALGQTDSVYHTVYFAQPQVAEKLSAWLEIPSTVKPTVTSPVPPPELLEADPLAIKPPGAGPKLRRRRGPGTQDFTPPLESAEPQRPIDLAQPSVVNCYFGAQMAQQPKLGSRTRIEVIMSRKSIDLVVSATSAVSGPVPTSTELPLTIEVIALKNGKILDPNPAEVTTVLPADDHPVKFVFRVDGNAVGAAEFLIEVRQSARVIASMTLRPIFVNAEAEELTASSAVRIEPHPAAGATLRIYEIQPLPGRTEFRFDLECADPNININQIVRLRDEFKRDVYVTEILKNIEATWFRDGNARDRFMLALRSLGEDMARALLPERLRRALWANRRRIAAIQVLSEDTSIPWELMFLSDPDAMEVDGEGFLADYGIIRWLHDTPWPPHRLFFRPDRVRYVVPVYPVEDYVLPDAEKERQELQRMFPGAMALEADSVVLASQLRRPGPIDVLHVSGHGESSSTAVISANLLMAGRIGPDGRYEEDPLTDAVVRNQLAFEPNSHPLVFLNCCRAGRTGNSIAGVGGFAGAFLRPTSGRGAGAFVGAQWSVGDNTALTFARSFYEALLAGRTLVYATRAARTAAKSAGELSWLAYTIYGDPMAVRA